MKHAAIAALCGVLLTSIAASAPPAKQNSQRYLVGFNASNRTALIQTIQSNGGRVVIELRNVSGLVADLSDGGVNAVRRSGTATSVEADSARQLHAHLPDFTNEFLPWGVLAVRADNVWSTNPGANTPAVQPGAVAGQGTVVGVLDTGIDFDHPDLGANLIDDRGSGVIRDFIDGDDDASDPVDPLATLRGHGTSSASVIASVDNAVGVIGVAPKTMVRPYRICFADQTRGCPLSAIIAGIDQAITDGVNVINMSLGGAAGFNLEASTVQEANRRGIVVVASAGNDASQKPSFPAAYDTVLAVGAIDEQNNPASFTNTGGWVDVTGPGVDVPAATVRGEGRDAFAAVNSGASLTLDPNPLSGSAVGSRTADLVYVGLATEADIVTFCASNACAGRIALISRGAITFAEKVTRAEAAGAVGTIIFNNVPGNFFGTLGTSPSTFPSISISQEQGTALRTAVQTGTVNVTISVTATDYELVSGTSFSAPHVAGVAALVRSANQSLAPIDVRKIIQSTAIDLGAPNRDNVFGWGLVNAEAAVSAALAAN